MFELIDASSARDLCFWEHGSIWESQVGRTWHWSTSFPLNQFCSFDVCQLSSQPLTVCLRSKTKSISQKVSKIFTLPFTLGLAIHFITGLAERASRCIETDNRLMPREYRWVILFARQKHTWGPLNSSPFATKVNLCTLRALAFISFAIIRCVGARRKELRLLGGERKRANFSVPQVKYYESKFSVSPTLKFPTFNSLPLSLRVFMLFLDLLSSHINAYLIKWQHMKHAHSNGKKSAHTMRA